MLGLEFFDARHGDAFLVRWAGRAMLVDGGPSGLYEGGFRERLLTRLPLSPRGVPVIDTVVLSHIDDDHAGGLLRLLSDLRRTRRDQLPEPVEVCRLWFNAVEELVRAVDPVLAASVQPLYDVTATSTVIAASYAQGRAIQHEAAALGLSGNPPFASALIEGLTTNLHGLEVTVVAPDQCALDALAQKWRKARELEDSKVVTAAYADGSIPNLSSLVLHIEFAGRTALLTGDARGDRILQGLENCGLVDEDGKTRLTVLKLPHHGSDRNVAPEFFRRVVADHYVISADGVRHHHPNEKTLEALVSSRDLEDAYTVHLTNAVPFALAKLSSLTAGRAFRVAVRSNEEPVLRIELT